MKQKQTDYTSVKNTALALKKLWQFFTTC